MFLLIRGAVATLIFIVLLVIILRSKWKKKILWILLSVVISYSIYVYSKQLQPERLFLRFDTPIEAFSYFHPLINTDTVMVVYGENSAYIFGHEDTIVLKDNDKWKSTNQNYSVEILLLYPKAVFLQNNLHSDVGSIHIIRCRETGESYFWYFGDEDIAISDSMGTEFFQRDLGVPFYNAYAYLGHITEGYEIRVGSLEYSYTNGQLTEKE